jgi:hypothetical protein
MRMEEGKRNRQKTKRRKKNMTNRKRKTRTGGENKIKQRKYQLLYHLYAFIIQKLITPPTCLLP